MDQVDSFKRTRRRPRQQFGGIAREQFDVADVVRFDLGEDLCHAVDIGFAADEADMRKAQRLRDQMLAAAKSDFQAHALRLWVEQRCEVRRTRAGNVEREMRQQVLDQIGLMDAELVALAPPEERAVRVNRSAIAGRRVAMIGIARGAAHRNV